MKSLTGFLSSVILLAMPLVAILIQIIFGNGAETTIHLVGAIGFILISISVFDFALPKWINRIGCLAGATLALIFLLQGASDFIQNDSFTYFAFQILGQRLEGWLVDLLIFWFVMLLLFDSQDKTKILGIVVMSVVVSLEVFNFILTYQGSSLNEVSPALKLLYLLMFVWFLFESRKTRAN